MSKLEKDVKEKQFNMLAHFEMKAEPVEMGDEPEKIKLSGIANFQGSVDSQGYGTYVDLAGEVVQAAGVDIKVYKSNPVILWQHDRDKPIGKATKIEKRKDGLYIECEIFKDACEDEVYNAIKLGIVSTFSIGFRVIQSDRREVGNTIIKFIMKSVLLECSVVSVPCNSASSFSIIKALDDGEGFYGGELNNTEKSEGEEQMTEEQLQLFRSELISAVKETVQAELKAAEEAKAAAEAELKEKEAAEAALKAEEEARAQAELEAKEAAEVLKRFSEEVEAKEADQIKQLAEIISQLRKTILENE